MTNPETLEELLILKNGLEKITNLEGFAVNYAISRTISRTKEFIAAIEKQEKKVAEIAKKFDDDVNAIITKLAAGNTIQTSNGPVPQVPKDKMAEYQKEYEKLCKKHKVDLDKRTGAVQLFAKFLKETKPTGFEIYGVEQKDVPANITTEQMKCLFPIIID